MASAVVTPGSGPAAAKGAVPPLPADAPTLDETARCVQCIRSFGAVQRLKSVTRSKATTIIMPDAAADSFTLGDLEAFFDQKRTSRAEFSEDLLCRMVSYASPNHIVDAAGLRASAALGPYARDWRRVLHLAQSHVQRATSATARRAQAARAVVPIAPSSARGSSARLRPAAGASGVVPRAPNSARSRRGPTTTGSSTAVAVAAAGGTVTRKPRTARAPQPPPPPSSSFPGGGDEFRDGNGRKRLYLPTVDHPPWSQHAGGVYRDKFDDLRRNGAGQSVSGYLEEKSTASLLRSMHVTPNTSGIVDCGTSVVKGGHHPRAKVSRGALLLDMSRIEGRNFTTRFSEQFQGPERLPVAESLAAIGAKVAPCIRTTGSDAVNRRIDQSIARVVTYLDGAC